MRLLTRILLLITLACALSTGSFAVGSSMEAPEAKNFRVLLEGTSKTVPIRVEALVSLNDGFQKTDAWNQLSLQISKDATGKFKVRFNLQNTVRVTEGQTAQTGMSVAYYFKPEQKTLVMKSDDAEIYLTIKEE